MITIFNNLYSQLHHTHTARFQLKLHKILSAEIQPRYSLKRKICVPPLSKMPNECSSNPFLRVKQDHLPENIHKYPRWISGQFIDIQIIRVYKEWMYIILAFDCSEACKYLFLTKRPKNNVYPVSSHILVQVFLLIFEISILVLKASID